MNEYKKDWNKRPKGCHKTTSGMHIPHETRLKYGSVYDYVDACKACGIIDDDPKKPFARWLYGPPQIMDDSNPL